MLFFIFYTLILFSLLRSCSAVCCSNHNFACLINAETCNPNCADGISLCNCPAACLNDDFGGCDTSYTCNGPNDDGYTAIYITSILTGYVTSTDTVYVTTGTMYYSTITSVDVVTADSTNVATSTIYQTITSTVYVTVPGPQATITGRAILETDDVQQANFDVVTSFRTRIIAPHLLRRQHRFVKRTVTVTSTYYDPTNYCGNSGFPPCVTTLTQAIIYNQVATATVQSTYYNYVNSVVYTTIDSYYYVTLTSTAPGNTVTIAPSTTSTPPSATPKSTSSTEADVTVTNMNTAVVTAPASSAAAVNSDGNVVVTNSNTAIATVTAPASSSNQAGPGSHSWNLMEICSLMLWQLLFHVM